MEKFPRQNILNSITRLQKKLNCFRANIENNGSFFTTKLNKFYDALPQNDNDVYVNYLFQFNENKKKGLTKEKSIEIEEYIKKLIIEKAKMNPYGLELIEHLKVNKENKTSFTYLINKEINIVYTAQQALFETFESSDKVVGYKLEWNLGNRIIAILRRAPKFLNLKKNLEIDFKELRNILFLVENLSKKTPPTSVNKDVVLTSYFSSIATVVTEPKLLHLMVILTLHNQIKYELITYKTSNKLINEETLSTLVKEFELRSEDKKKNYIDILTEIKFQCINIINMYAKIIGLELTDFFNRKEIIIKTKELVETKRKIFFYQLKDAVAKHMVTHKLPNIYLPEYNEIIKNDLVINQNTKKAYIGYTITNKIIEKVGMDATILDENIWYNSQGTFKLNFSLIKEFINLMEAILERKETNSLELEDINFLSSFYRFNFNIFNENKQMLDEIITHALDFEHIKLKKTFKKKYDYFSSHVLDRIFNKIYQQKFLFIYLLENLEVLLHFEHFQFSLVFDQRGRSYPEASLINHLQPIFKHFFSWHSKIPKEPANRNGLVSLIIDKLKAKLNPENIRSMDTKTHNTIPLKFLCKVNYGKNLFEYYLLCNDIKNLLENNKGTLKSYYSVDACSSGLQILAMLTRSRELATACGMIVDKKIIDIYTQFIERFHERIEMLKSIIQKMGQEVYEFVSIYYNLFKENKFNESLKKKYRS